MLPAQRNVHLCNVASGKNLRMLPNTDVIDFKGGNAAPTQWAIDPSPTGFLRLRNLGSPGKYLAIRDGKLTSGTRKDLGENGSL